MTIILYYSLLTDSVLPDMLYLSSQGVALLSHPDRSLHEIIIIRGLQGPSEKTIAGSSLCSQSWLGGLLSKAMSMVSSMISSTYVNNLTYKAECILWLKYTKSICSSHLIVQTVSPLANLSKLPVHVIRISAFGRNCQICICILTCMGNLWRMLHQ